MGCGNLLPSLRGFHKDWESFHPNPAWKMYWFSASYAVQPSLCYCVSRDSFVCWCFLFVFSFYYCPCIVTFPPSLSDILSLSRFHLLFLTYDIAWYDMLLVVTRFGESCSARHWWWDDMEKHFRQILEHIFVFKLSDLKYPGFVSLKKYS